MRVPGPLASRFKLVQNLRPAAHSGQFAVGYFNGQPAPVIWLPGLMDGAMAFPR
jgi:hypothetical protein